MAAMVITLPMVVPLVLSFGYDLVWWGIINVVVIGIGMLAPPIGINVMVLHSMYKSVPLRTIYVGILPFLCAEFARLTLLTLFPEITLWLPQMIR
ncbi:TRAP transporter large permease subunit [Mesorhizobium sp. J428]|uniref:TRAP transporter large permease subunit n=1 Tax=Mesorhizobium sp. J428 TaxID=2898440 RepID=UPI0021513090|nr:TRAP transporter large permease subunit [Mesorhizobium sp. J428]